MAENRGSGTSGLTEAEVSWLVPHQANERIIDATATMMGVSTHKVHKTLAKYGNTSASSIAIALYELVSEKKVIAGDRLLLVAFGAGLTWGAVLLTSEK